MRVNADFERRASVHAAAMRWTPSPMKGVERKMLDRIGEEVARATSIVRYSPGSHFSPHTHGGGEEFLVLDGVFEDEHGAYPAGSYVRNPPRSRHTPGAPEGCTILVKLWQFDPEDRQGVRLRADDVATHLSPDRPGVASAELYKDARESVRIERWAPGARVSLAPAGGLGIFCLAGAFSEGGETFETWSWLRLPVGASLDAVAGKDGSRVWIKEGHLRFVDASVPAASAGAH